MPKKTGLGKGLDALFGPTPEEEQVEKIEQIQNENITIINNIDQELEKQKAKSSTMVDLLKAQEIELNNYGQKIEELEKNNETKKELINHFNENYQKEVKNIKSDFGKQLNIFEDRMNVIEKLQNSQEEKINVSNQKQEDLIVNLKENCEGQLNNFEEKINVIEKIQYNQQEQLNGIENNQRGIEDIKAEFETIGSKQEELVTKIEQIENNDKQKQNEIVQLNKKYNNQDLQIKNINKLQEEIQSKIDSIDDYIGSGRTIIDILKEIENKYNNKNIKIIGCIWQNNAIKNINKYIKKIRNNKYEIYDKNIIIENSYIEKCKEDNIIRYIEDRCNKCKNTDFKFGYRLIMIIPYGILNFKKQAIFTKFTDKMLVLSYVKPKHKF